MRKLALLVLLPFVLSSCEKHYLADDADLSKCVKIETTIEYQGKFVDSCDDYMFLNPNPQLGVSSWMHPINLPDKFKKDGMAVEVYYERLETKIQCGFVP